MINDLNTIRKLASQVGIKWDMVDYTIEDFAEGYEEEMEEHKSFSAVQCAQIAKDHFDEYGAKYYEYLEAVEERIEKEDDEELDVILTKY